MRTGLGFKDGHHILILRARQLFSVKLIGRDNWDSKQLSGL